MFIKSIIKFMRDIILVLFGSLYYLFTNRNSKKFMQSVINLFCVTGGISNTFMSKVVCFFSKKYTFGSVNGIVGCVTEERAKEIANSIESDGYYIFPQKLDSNTINKIVDFTYKNSAQALYFDGTRDNSYKSYYGEPVSTAVCYDYDPSQIHKESWAQKLLADLSLLSIAQEYLGCKPVVEEVTLRWTLPSEKSNTEAAQLFHFDMDRLKWLKIFIYLTDVDEKNGPHVFVSGSHRDNGIPREIRKHGYARISDQEVLKYYPQNDLMHICGKAGTIIAVDTRGLHKGREVVEGSRLLLQIQYSNSLFGAEFNKYVMPENSHVNLQLCSEKYPAVFQKYSCV